MSIRRDIRTDAVNTAENWAIAAEFFDDETGRHCYRVGHLASMLAREIGMDETFCVQVEHAARLHDIGKIAVNEVILLKPGPLDAAEMAAMRLHTEVGAQILAGSDDPDPGHGHGCRATSSRMVEWRGVSDETKR